MPECSNILYRLSQSCAIDRCCLFFNFKVISEDIWRSNILCLNQSCAHILQLCFGSPSTIVLALLWRRHWWHIMKICQMDSNHIMHCHFLTANTTRTLVDWVYRESQFGRIFVLFHFLLSWACVTLSPLPTVWLRSLTWEHERHPFPVQSHVLFQEEAKDHLHEMDLVNE